LLDSIEQDDNGICDCFIMYFHFRYKFEQQMAADFRS
jgi:hypothetical protein